MSNAQNNLIETCHRDDRRRRGLVLVSVLWLIMLLSVMVAVVAKTSRLDSRVFIANTEQVRAKWAGRAGVERAIALLNDDLKTSDGLDDLWSDNDIDCNDVILEGCTFSIKVIDEERKLNINTVTKQQMMCLPRMTKAIADAILDWRDGDSDLQPDGTEAGYYRNLQPGYEIRNGPFQTIRELLLVRDVTPALLFGEDTNLNGLLDFNENDGEENPPDDDQDSVLRKGWIEYVTCYSRGPSNEGVGAQHVNINQADEKNMASTLDIKNSYAKWIVENRNNGFESIGDLVNANSPKEPPDDDSDNARPIDLQTFARIADQLTLSDDDSGGTPINVNTASRTVLNALTGGDDALVNSIVSYRNTQLSGLYGIGELVLADAVGVAGFKKIGDSISTQSNVFTVVCIVTSGKTGATYRTEAVVDRGGQSLQVLYWYQGANY